MASTGSWSLATETRLDARGLKCPLPVLKLEKILATAAPDRRIVVLATDPMAKVDIPLYCRQHGHACQLAEADGILTFTISTGG